jgi:hypothetical protein
LTSYPNEIPIRRKLVIVEAAQKKRLAQCDHKDRFEPLMYIEHILPKTVRGFEFDYNDDDEVFRRAPDVQAVVDFGGPPFLLAKASLMSAASRGDHQARFVFCHEIGHVHLHTRMKGRLARHQIGSIEQYRTNYRLEMEANLFGGCLLAPPDGLHPGMADADISLVYGCSLSAARIAISNAKLWWRANGRKWP